MGERESAAAASPSQSLSAESVRPVCFPHTTLSGSALESMRACLPAVAIYQPVRGRLPQELQPLVAAGFLEVIAPPASGDEERFERLLRDYQQWGRLHAGGAGLAAVGWRGGGSDPSLSEADPALIAAQVRRQLSPAAAAPDALMSARLFLQLAQEHDQQSRQIDRDLAACEAAHAGLLDALRGGPGPAAPDPIRFGPARIPESGSEGWMESRMAAWARLFLHYPRPRPVFVTPSPAAIGYLAEKVPGSRSIPLAQLSDAVPLLDSGSRSPAENVAARLGLLAAGERLPAAFLPEAALPAGGSDSAAVFIWPEVSPGRLFGRLLPDAPPGRGSALPAGPVRHTVVLQVSAGSFSLGPAGP